VAFKEDESTGKAQRALPDQIAQNVYRESSVVETMERR
jgi:hypothetical protein